MHHGGNIRRVTRQETGSRRALLSVQLALVLLAVSVLTTRSGPQSSLPKPTIPLRRARVVAIEDPEAVRAFQAVETRLKGMVDQGLTELTGEPDVPSAWLSLVSPQDVIGIKVFSAPGSTSGTRPAVVSGLIQSLITAKFDPQRIIIWDKHSADLKNAGFSELSTRFGVQVQGAAEAGYEETSFYESPLLGTPVWGDLEFGKSGPGIGRNSHVSKLLTRKITKIINVTPLLNHNLAGVSGNLFGLAFGSVDNSIRFETSAQRMATAIPELFALPELWDRVVLNIVDALICQYQGEERTHLHYAAMLGQLRFSQDPVALDVLSVKELQSQRKLAGITERPINSQIFTNASLLEIGISDLSKIDLLISPRTSPPR
jgi:hypothetical protein